MESIQQWVANLWSGKIVYGTKSTEILDLLKVEKSPLRELGFMNEHSMYDHLKNADVIVGSYVHMKWLRDHEGDEVRCRLVATQLAICERLDVTQSTPPLMVARLMLAIASLHADENEVHDWVVGFWNVSVGFSDAKLESWCTFTRHEVRAHLGVAGSSTEHCVALEQLPKHGVEW